MIDQAKFIKIADVKQPFASLLLSGKRNARPTEAKRIGQATQTPWEVWTELGTAADRAKALQQSHLFQE